MVQHVSHQKVLFISSTDSLAKSCQNTFLRFIAISSLKRYHFCFKSIVRLQFWPELQQSHQKSVRKCCTRRKKLKRDSKFEKRLCELASEEDEFNEIGVTNEVFTDAISGLIETHQKEFETFKKKSSPLELTDEEKLKYREMQKSSKDS